MMESLQTIGTTRRWFVAGLVCAAAAATALVGSCASRPKPAADQGDQIDVEAADEGYAEIAKLADQPDGSASSAFWDHWGDSRAELSGYAGKISRYGHLRPARVALVYVTEAMSRKTWVKDQSARGRERVDVMKLNHSVKFQTGIYPYSVLTSVFSPVDHWGRPRFQPVKITTASQEWCGNFFMGIWPGPGRFLEEVHSYFAGAADHRRVVDTPDGTLYQDALLIQLRELDGPFAGGNDWRGQLVPSLWFRRSSHQPLKPVEATITRKNATYDGQPVSRFRLRYAAADDAEVTVTYDVETAGAHRILHWHRSDGSDFRLLKTTRLPYWKLHDPGDEHYREQMGLDAAELSTPGPSDEPK